MSEPKRIGVLGGTFDPIHNAHIDIARAAIDSAGLDTVLFIVSARPPHKSEEIYATPEQRLAMVEAALADVDKMEPSAIEIQRDGPSYTAETLRQLKKTYPDAELLLIMGYDSLLDLPGWKDPEAILALAGILAVSRPGLRRPLAPELDGNYEILPFKETPVSSTQIRQRIAGRQPVGHLLPSSVIEIINRESLYDDKVAGGASG